MKALKKLSSLTIYSKIILVFSIIIFVTNIVLLIFSQKLDTNSSQISRLIFNTIQISLMIGIILVPPLISKTTHFRIPVLVEVVLVTFSGMHLILGEINEFYSKISWWDSLLHTMSGIIIGALGYIIINTIDASEHNDIRLTPFFSSILIVIFAVSVGYFWEIFEWWADELFGSNMQRYLEEGSNTIGGGVPLVGHEALADTMKDMMLNLIGAVIMGIYGYVEMKRQKKGITTMTFKREKVNADINKNSQEMAERE